MIQSEPFLGICYNSEDSNGVKRRRNDLDIDSYLSYYCQFDKCYCAALQSLNSMLSKDNVSIPTLALV